MLQVSILINTYTKEHNKVYNQATELIDAFCRLKNGTAINILFRAMLTAGNYLNAGDPKLG